MSRQIRDFIFSNIVVVPNVEVMLDEVTLYFPSKCPVNDY